MIVETGFSTSLELPLNVWLISRSYEASEPLAQLVERLTFNQDVESSNLSGLTIFFNDLAGMWKFNRLP